MAPQESDDDSRGSPSGFILLYGVFSLVSDKPSRSVYQLELRVIDVDEYSDIVHRRVKCDTVYNEFSLAGLTLYSDDCHIVTQ